MTGLDAKRQMEVGAPMRTIAGWQLGHAIRTIGRACAAAVAALIIFQPLCAAQEYPSKPVRMIVAFPPGGSTDVIARLISAKLTETWGQQFVVDNRPGAGTNIGAELQARSPADG